MDLAAHRHRLEVPVGVIVGLLAVGITLAVDQVAQPPFAISATNARALLAASFGALVTAGAFSFWMLPVAAQLAASSVPPSAVSGRLEGRFQRRVVATTLSALAFTAVAVLALPADAGARAPTVTTVLAGILGVAAIAGLLLAIHHAVRSTRPSALLTEAAQDVVERICEGGSTTAARRHPDRRRRPGGGSSAAVVAPRTGWLSSVDEDGLLHDLPDRATVVLEVGIGSFVVRDWTRVATVHVPDPSGGLDRTPGLADHLTIADERSAERDLVGSITHFSDIAVHAGNGASGSPSIVYESFWHLGAILHELVRHDLGVVDRHLDDGRALEWTPEPGAPMLATVAVDRIRQATASMPAMALELVRVLGDASNHAAGAGRHRLAAVLDEQADLTVAQCRHADPLPADLERVVAMRDDIASGRGAEREEEYPTEPEQPADTR